MKKLLLIAFVFIFSFAGWYYTAVDSGGSPTTEFLDTFTEVSQTELASHDPDTGDASSWTRSDATAFYVEHTTGESGAVSLDDNSSSNINALNTTSVSGNVTITALVGFHAETSSANDRTGVWARASQSSWTMTGYNFRIEGDGGVEVYEVTSGSGTQLLTGSISGYVWSHEYRLICTLNGTTIGLVIQDVDDSDTQVFSDSTTDSDHSSGSAGLLMRGAESAVIAYCNSIKVETIP